MEIVVTGRRCEVSEKFRAHAAEKIERLERFDQRLSRIDVEVSTEANRRHDQHERIELTVHSKGPIVRAEASAQDRYAALDIAVDRLESRLRKSAEKRTAIRRHRTGVGQASAHAINTSAVVPIPVGLAGGAASDGAVDDADAFDSADQGPFIVREKVHDATAMSLDDAFYEMELVGHDFFLFVDSTTAQPSVIYRRKGYDYGVIRLNLAS